MKTALVMTLLALLASPSLAQKDIVDTAVSAGSLNTLAKALGAAELVETLKGKGPFTVFAPTDAAFAKLPKGTVQTLLRPENRWRLQAVLKNHVVAGRVTGTQALQARKAKTLLGTTQLITLRDGRLSVGNAGVTANDVRASNGVIHVIDRVLVPADKDIPRPKGDLIIGVFTSSPSASLAAQLRLNAKQSLLVTSLTKGGPAQRAGLKRFDVITHIDGKPATSSQLKRAKQSRGPGGALDLVIIREARKRNVSVPVALDPH